MDDPAANRAVLALLLLVAAWAVIFLWFKPTGWFIAAVMVAVAFCVAPQLH